MYARRMYTLTNAHVIHVICVLCVSCCPIYRTCRILKDCSSLMKLQQLHWNGTFSHLLCVRYERYVAHYVDTANLRPEISSKIGVSAKANPSQ